MIASALLNLASTSDAPDLVRGLSLKCIFNVRIPVYSVSSSVNVAKHCKKKSHFKVNPPTWRRLKGFLVKDSCVASPSEFLLYIIKLV